MPISQALELFNHIQSHVTTNQRPSIATLASPSSGPLQFNGTAMSFTHLTQASSSTYAPNHSQSHARPRVLHDYRCRFPIDLATRQTTEQTSIASSSVATQVGEDPLQSIIDPHRPRDGDDNDYGMDELSHVVRLQSPRSSQGRQRLLEERRYFAKRQQELDRLLQQQCKMNNMCWIAALGHFAATSVWLAICYKTLNSKARAAAILTTLLHFALKLSTAATLKKQQGLYRFSLEQELEMRMKTNSHLGPSCKAGKTSNPGNGGFTCLVCMDEKLEACFTDCGHVCCCEKCARLVSDQAPQRRKCPLCRKAVLQRPIRVYF